MINAYRGLFPHTSANPIKNFLWKVCLPLFLIAEIIYGIVVLFFLRWDISAMGVVLFLAVCFFSKRLRALMADFFNSAPRVMLMIGKKWSRFFTGVAAGLIERRSDVAQVRRSATAMLLFTVACAVPGLLATRWMVQYAQTHLAGHAYLAAVTLTALAFATLISIVACAVDYFNDEVRFGVPGHLRLRTIGFEQDPVRSADHYLGTVVHFSDLHVPDKSHRLTEAGTWDQAFLPTLTARMKEIQTARTDTVFVVSGDITDTGAQSAWEAVREAMLEFQRDIVIAPGNHDLNIVGYGMGSLIFVGDKIDWSGRWNRMTGYMHAACKLMGARTNVWSKTGMVDLASAWSAIEDSGRSNNAKFREAESLFPLIVSASGMEGAQFIVWNTVRSSSLAFNNSFGEVGDRQLANFEAIRQSPEHASTRFIHIMHHKLTLPEHRLIVNSDASGWLRIWHAMKSAVQLVGMVMHDANKVVAAVRGGMDSVVLHGHHHAAFWGEIDDASGAGGVMQVVSAPSTSLGVEFFTKSPAMSNVTQVGPRSCSYELLRIEKTARGLRLAAPPQHVSLP